MSSPENFTRKAAILVASLDSVGANALLKQLAPADAARVRRAVVALDTIDPDERNAVIDEFMRQEASASKLDLPGVELEGSLARKLASPTSDYDVKPTTIESPPFEFLHETAADTLVTFLRDERPQTIALVVSHLAPDKAADVLGRLSDGTQVEVVRCLVDIDWADPDVVREVERHFESALNEQLRSARRRAAGLKAVGRILDAADSTRRKELLGNVLRLNGDLASKLDPGATRPQPVEPAADVPKASASNEGDRLRQRLEKMSEKEPAGQEPIGPGRVVLQFRDLARLDNRALAIVLAEADQRLIPLALAGAGEELAGRVTRLLPSRQAGELQRRIDRLGPLRLSDVEQAQRGIAAVAGMLITRGIVRLPARGRLAVAA